MEMSAREPISFYRFLFFSVYPAIAIKLRDLEAIYRICQGQILGLTEYCMVKHPI